MIGRIVIIGLVAFGLAACQSTRVDTAIEKNLPKICSGAAQIHSAFVVIAATGDVKQSLVRKEAAAYAALRSVCDDPASVNSSNALVVAAEAYAAMVVALRDAK